MDILTFFGALYIVEDILGIVGVIAIICAIVKLIKRKKS